MILVGAEFESNIWPKGNIQSYFGSPLLYLQEYPCCIQIHDFFISL
jgi:hypothetical protein